MGSCVPKASAADCWSIPLINIHYPQSTLDWYLINTSVDTRSTSRATVGRESTMFQRQATECQSSIDQVQLVNRWPPVYQVLIEMLIGCQWSSDWDIYRVSIKCWSRVHQRFIKGWSRVSMGTWLWMPLVHVIQNVNNLQLLGCDNNLFSWRVWDSRN